MEVAVCVFDLKHQNLSDSHLFISELCWKRCTNVQDKHCLPSQWNRLRLHFNLFACLFSLSQQVSYQCEIEAIRAPKGYLSLFLSLSFDRRNLYHTKSLLRYELLAAFYERNDHSLPQIHLQSIREPFDSHDQPSVDLIIYQIGSLDPHNKNIAAFLSSLKPKLVKVFIGIFFASSKYVFLELIESLVFEDYPHRDDFRYLLVIFHAKNDLLLMYSPRNALFEIDRINIQDNQLSDTSVGWLGLSLWKGRRLVVQEGVCDFSQFLNHSLRMLQSIQSSEVH